MAIEFTNKPIKWTNKGTAPSEDLKTNGFQAGYKPPAAVFNNQWHVTGECIDELQDKLSAENTARTFHESNTSNPHNVTKAQVGLGNVDNTSDTDKPVSTATRTELNGKAPTSHASSATTYGVGTSSYYGHVKLANNLTTTDTSGYALNAYQGKVLNDKITSAQEAITAADKVFVATYGTTTFQEIVDAFNAGKEVMCKLAFYIYRLNRVNGNTRLIFTNTNETEVRLISVWSDDEWKEPVTYKIPTINNLTSIDLLGSNTVNNSFAIAGGECNTINADYGVAFGYDNTVSGESSFVVGNDNTAVGYQFKGGHYSKDGTAGSYSGTIGDAVIIGNGTSSAQSNCFRVSYSGNVYGLSSFKSTGADYAEYFEWADGNPDNEDRRGRLVTLDGDKIRFATATDTYILGVVSAVPCVGGDVHSDDWQGKYLTDVFGQRLTQTVHIPAKYEERETIDPKTGETVTEKILVQKEHDSVQWILNPDYDPEKEYVSREDRKEWSAVGLIGKLVVTDDGTCEVNGYCKAGVNGIATKADDGYRVMARIDDTHIRVLVR